MQKNALNTIAKKLKLHITQKEPQIQEKNIEAILAKETPIEEPTTAQKPIIQKKNIEAILAKETPKEEPNPFEYFSSQASCEELNVYLSNKETKDNLSFNQYIHLKKRYLKLKEEKMLKNASLQTLITYYKTNKNPKIKKRILELMKKVQK